MSTSAATSDNKSLDSSSIGIGRATATTQPWIARDERLSKRPRPPRGFDGGMAEEELDIWRDL
ncbi:hypothetical protein FWH09_02955 [Candidatus Saccharibacteria bacterium]|nr:hypothetical protein [Candidatus Saccharibacteria bacterium]